MSLHAVDMKPIDSILSEQGRSILGTRPFQTNVLQTFEQLGQFSGFVLYEATLPKLSRDPSNLIVTGLRDRALVYIDHEFVGTLSRENVINTLPISAGFGSKLSILVENQGRLNFAVTDDHKVGRFVLADFSLIYANLFAGNSWRRESSNFPRNGRDFRDSK